MKKHFSQIWIIIPVIVLVVSCLDAPEYSDVPKIKFKRLTYVDVDGAADSLKVTFDFEDGNGDVGLESSDVFGSYIPFFYILYFDEDREVIVDGEVELVSDYFQVELSDDRAKPPFYLADESFVYVGEPFSEVDNRPAFNCTDYQTELNSDDTIFVVRNEFHSNFHLKFFKKLNGDYYETSIAEEFNIDDCNQVVETLRIPIFDPERFGKPTIGNITYSYVSNGISPFLSQDTFKLQFFIYDRALNASNIVDSPDYILSDIAR